MPQSVKLSDGSYLDSAGVYDTSLGMTQQAINNAVSHVGQIIFSTTLDTMEKVVAVYGGTTWSKIEGRFLVGASSSYANGSTGGEASHKLTVSEMPSHTHSWSIPIGGWSGWASKSMTSYVLKWGDTTMYNADTGTSTLNVTNSSLNGGNGYTGSTSAHNNMPPYRAVYIWERTA